jgi:hypothetical protein
MRGDSLRDFYAKTIALLGLALVGAVGALVDYWPAGQPLPRIAGAPPAPAIVDVAARRADTAVADAAAAWAHPRPAARRSNPVPRRVSPAALPVQVASISEVLVARTDVTFEPPVRAVPSIAVQPIASLPTTTVSLVAPLTPEPAEMTFAQHASGQGAADQSFLADATEAAKKAGNTIVASTMKTGATIVDGLRSFGGAVRRGLWRF